VTRVLQIMRPLRYIPRGIPKYQCFGDPIPSYGLRFKQIESQVYTSRITSDSTKYHHVVAAMESEVVQHVTSLYISTLERYVRGYKATLDIERFSKSKELWLKKY